MDACPEEPGLALWSVLMEAAGAGPERLRVSVFLGGRLGGILCVHSEACTLSLGPSETPPTVALRELRLERPPPRIATPLFLFVLFQA